MENYSYIRGQGQLDIPYKTIPNLIKQHAERNPQAVAQIALDWETFEKETLTFHDLYNDALKFAKGLMRLGVKKGDILAIGTDNSKDWMISVVGTMICGAVCLLFSFNKKDGTDVVSIMNKVGERCRIMIFPPGKNDMYLPILENIIKTDSVKGNVHCEGTEFLEKAIAMTRETSTKYLTMEDLMKMEETVIVPPQTDPEDVAAIFMTSGSTGIPKLIPHTHLSLIMTGFHFSVGYGVSQGMIYNDRIFSWIGGFPCWEIATGGTRVYLKHVTAIPSINRCVDALEHVFTTEKIDGCLMMVSVFPQLAQKDLTAWNFNNVSLGGSPMSQARVKLMMPLCRKLIILYGSTEVCMNTFFVCEKDKNFPDFTCGKPFPGVEVKVVDQDGMLVKRGIRGEAYVRTSVQFTGYLGDEEITSAALNKNGWYRTGDSTIMLEDGNILVEGRISDSLIESGNRYLSASVSYIESYMKQHPFIRDTEAIAVSDENNLQRICCAIIWKEGAKISEEELDDYLIDSKQYTVTFYRRLRASIKFFAFENFPRTHNGKVDRKELAILCKEQLNGN